MRDQLIGEIADRARLAREDLARRWGVAAAARTGNASSPFRRPPALPRARTAARQPQEQAARILLQRSDWWHELTAEDHSLLMGLSGWHADLFKWLERWLTEHGAAAWTELREPLTAEEWGAQAIALVDGAEVPVEPELADLRAALAQTQRAQQSLQSLKLLGRA